MKQENRSFYLDHHLASAFQVCFCNQQWNLPSSHLLWNENRASACWWHSSGESPCPLELQTGLLPLMPYLFLHAKCFLLIAGEPNKKVARRSCFIHSATVLGVMTTWQAAGRPSHPSFQSPRNCCSLSVHQLPHPPFQKITFSNYYSSRMLSNLKELMRTSPSIYTVISL